MLHTMVIFFRDDLGNTREVGRWWSFTNFGFMSQGEALRFVTASLARWLKHWASSAALCNDLFRQKEQVVQRKRAIGLLNPVVVLPPCRSIKAKCTQLHKQIGESGTVKVKLRISISLALLWCQTDPKKHIKKNLECPTNGRLELLRTYIYRFLSGVV